MSRFEHVPQAVAELVDELHRADRLSLEQADRIEALEAEIRRLRQALTTPLRPGQVRHTAGGQPTADAAQDGIGTSRRC